MMAPSGNDWKWVGPYFVIFVANSIPSSAMSALLGPAQPFLAKKVGVEVDSINFLWTISRRIKMKPQVLSTCYEF